MADPSTIIDYKSQEDLSSTDTTSGLQNAYMPTKKERFTRRLVWNRYAAMQADPGRVEAQEEWDEADKAFRQYMPVPDPDDWRSHIVLPDEFAAIQAQMQETIDRKSRPQAKRVEDSDKGKEKFANAILSHNMDRTGFDYQNFLSKYVAAIRGTAFLIERYRVDKREVMDPTSVNADGTLQYTKKEITDFDDTETVYIDNDWVFVDPDGTDITDKADCIIRELIDIDEFHRVYGMKADFMNVELVKSGGDTGNKGFFRLPVDMMENQVEVLHYYNRVRDLYSVLANNVLVRIGPIPYKHKELPVTPVYHYRVPGRFYGMGIPKVIASLSAERTAIRRLRLDRQKMQINKMFLHNNQFDLDDEDLITRPHGLISVNTNGLPLNQVMQPIEYGDVQASAYKEDDALLEDIRRAHGIDDRIENSNVGGTATQAAILKEASLKRINLISQLTEMDTMIRIGRLKWSNIQFFYPAPRIERTMQDNEERENKVYRTVTTQGQEFNVVKDDVTGENKLEINEIEGSHTFKLDKAMAKFMEGDFDIEIDASAFTQISKPIQQSKITEMFNLLAANPSLLGVLDPRKAVARYLEVNDEDPKNWLVGDGKTDADWMILADKENLVMSQGVPLAGTQDATEIHTLMHIHYTETKEYDALPESAKQMIGAHILEEHDNNPQTGSAADAMAQAGQGAAAGAGAPPGSPGAGQAPVGPGAPGAPAGPGPFLAASPLSPVASVQDPTAPATPFIRGNRQSVGIQTSDQNRQLQPADIGAARPGSARK